MDVSQALTSALLNAQMYQKIMVQVAAATAVNSSEMAVAMSAISSGVVDASAADPNCTFSTYA